MGNGQDYPHPLHTGERLRALARANQQLRQWGHSQERAERGLVTRSAKKISRTLDELPPQTRRLLGLLDEMVTAECGQQGLDRGFRFSRRQVREQTAWGDTQLKVHLV